MPRLPIRIGIAAAFAFLVAAGSPADRTAPLPDGVAASGEAGVRGVYAERIYGRLEVNEAVAQLEAACGKRAAIAGRDLQWKGRRRLYRSRDRVAVFEETPTIRSDVAACTARITLAREVRVASASRTELDRAGWTDRIPTCPPRTLRRCSERVVAGVAARCVDFGDGFVGEGSCFSIQRDLSRGLELAGWRYTDDGSGPDDSWEMGVAAPDALIDPAVFRAGPRQDADR